MKVTDLNAETLLAFFSNLRRSKKDHTTAELMLLESQSEHFKRLIKENKELKEQLHEIGHMTLAAMYQENKLCDMSIVDLIMTSFTSGIYLGVELSEFNVLNPTSVPMDISQFN